MIKVTLLTGEQVIYNERVIQRIEFKKDGTYDLFHFNNSSIQIKNFERW
jgi:uncharacterized protein YlzI (FlbEa/FlbD family)